MCARGVQPAEDQYTYEDAVELCAARYGQAKKVFTGNRSFFTDMFFFVMEKLQSKIFAEKNVSNVN